MFSSQLGDDRQQSLLIRLIPGKCLQEERDTVLVDRHPEDERLEIPPTVLRMAVGGDHVAGVEVGIVLASDAERGGVDMEAMRAVVAGEEALGHDPVEKFGQAIGCDRVEGSAQDVAVEVINCHAIVEKSADGDVCEELRIQVQPPFEESEAVGCHDLDNLAVDEAVVSCLGDGTINGPSDAEGVESASNDPEMADRDVGTFGEISGSGQKKGFPESTRILRFDSSITGTN